MSSSTMCTNKECPRRHQCSRFMDQPELFGQSYAAFDCENNKDDDYFLEILE